jgi:O-antigen ligase
VARLVTICDRVMHWGLIGLLVFTPAAFGTVETWSIALMEWGIVTLAIVLALMRLWPDAGPTRPRRLWSTGLEWPIALFLAFCLLQTIPLPAPVLATVSPGGAALYSTPNPRLSLDQGRVPADMLAREPLFNLPAGVKRPISVSAPRTLQQTGLVASLCLIFFVAAAWATTSDRVVAVLRALTAIGFLVALQGIVQFLTWNGKILWFRSVPPTSAFGPFVNRDHFAGYAEMLIPVAIGMVVYVTQQARGPRIRLGDGWGIGSVLEDGGGKEERWGKIGLAIFVVAIIIVALLFSRSRAGILSMLITGLIFFALLWRRTPSRLGLLVGTVSTLLVVIGLVAWIGSDVVREQLKSYDTLEREASFRNRIMVWETMVDHLPAFLWVGSGLGTFEDSFAPFMVAGSAKRWDRAHNDYLQLLWETGLVGFLLFLAGGVIFVRRYWWPALHARGHPMDCFRAGIALALLSLALHSIVDFNLQIGANGFLFAFLAGLIVGLDRVVNRAADTRGVRPVPVEGTP